jgi:hypothetical protein
MNTHKLTFAIANPVGEILVDGYVDEELEMVLLHDFEDWTTEEDRALIQNHFLRGADDSKWWIESLRMLEEDFIDRFAIACSPALRKLLDESRQLHSS